MAILAAASHLSVEDVRRFTVEEFDRLVELCILSDEERVELLEGVLVPMPPIGDLHAGSVDYLTELLTMRLAGRALIRGQNPIALPTSRLYPDVAILKRRPDYYRTSKPGVEDIFLVIEVADTSLARDRDVKLPTYGRAGIGEAWVIDLGGQSVIVGRDPAPAGYATLRTCRRGERLTVPGFADVTLAIDELLGPPTST